MIVQKILQKIKQKKAEVAVESFVRHVLFSQWDEALKLVEKVDFSLKNFYRETPLHVLTRKSYDSQKRGSYLRLLAAVLKKNPDVNAPDNHGCRPLLNMVCFAKSFLGAEMLLRAGADPNVVDMRGKTPLHYVGNDAEMADLLLEYGARTDICDDKGKTARDVIFGNNFFDVIEVLNRHTRERQQQNTKAGVSRVLGLHDEATAVHVATQAPVSVEKTKTRDHD